MILDIILVIITVIAITISVRCVSTKIELNREAKETNAKLQKEIFDKKQELISLHKTSHTVEDNLQQLQSKVKLEQQHLQAIEESERRVKESIESQESLSKKAFSNYVDVLDTQYKATEEEYDRLIKNLEKSYSELQHKLMAETDECRADLEKMRSTRAAAIQANLREDEIKQNIDFYCLQLSSDEIYDISRLNAIKPSLKNPRILSMLIWSSIIQKPFKALITKIFGTNTIVGIYKITNQLNGMVYIGQSVNVQDRMVQHAKCGCDIDRPASNKLYAAMLKDGIWNFSFELLEECNKSELNEKEKFFINLYDAKNFGYNETQGNH